MTSDEKHRDRKRRRQLGWTWIAGLALRPIISWAMDRLTDLLS